MDEEILEPLNDNLSPSATRDNLKRLLAKEEKQLKLRSSSFSDSLDRSDNEYYSHELGQVSSHQTCHHQRKPLPTVRVTRLVSLPDRVRVDRSLRLPEFGPKLLFFSGGTAIKDLSTCLTDYTHNSVHLITPFDSGGSSAEIRRAFTMLSVGDLRNRLLSLSARESTARNNPQIIALFSHRLEKNDPDMAEKEFVSIVLGQHPLTRAVRMPMRSILQNHLKWFAERMPEDFDLRGASIGNLIITGCFLEHDQDIVSVIYMISKFLGIKGFVRPLTGANLHIRTRYSDGREEVGQHLMNKGKDKSTSSTNNKIVDIDLVEFLDLEGERQESQTCYIDIVSSDLVASADLIVFPMGSFFASILVNLLPKGVGRAIVKRKCPKIYIPNTGFDFEMNGYTLVECVQRIVDMIRADHVPCDSETQLADPLVPPIKDILSFVLLDTLHCDYAVEIDKAAIENLGVVVIDVPLVDASDLERCDGKSTRLNPIKVAEVLISLAA
jgi:CofD-related protein of GAK system